MNDDIETQAGQPREKPTDSRAAILAATEALLLEAGYDGFSIRKLVQRCGFTAPTIYHHFGDKQGLLDELLEARIQSLVADIRAVPLVENSAENLRRLFHAFADFGIRNPTHYALINSAHPEQTDAIPAAREAKAILLAPLEQLEREGRIYGGDLEQTRQVVWSFLHGLISLQSTRPHEDWNPNLLEISLDALIRGCIQPLPEEGDQ